MDMSNGNDSVSVSLWSKLPPEILQLIGEKTIDSTINFIRFRSVCMPWRSSVHTFTNPHHHLPPIKLPDGNDSYGFLSPSTIYRLEKPSSDRSSQNHCWLVRIEELNNGKLQLWSPLLTGQGRLSKWSKSLNLLNFRAIELSRCWSIKDDFFVADALGFTKLVLYPKNVIREIDDFCSIIAIYLGGKLGVWKKGDTEWTLLDHVNFHYDDILIHKGQYYVVDTSGTIFWIDSSLNLIQYSPLLYGCGGQKHLMESQGNLYVIDRYLDGQRTSSPAFENDAALFLRLRTNLRLRKPLKDQPRTVGFMIHKLDEELGTWVNVITLDHQFLLVGDLSCFSVSATDFGVGCKTNCIYFTEKQLSLEERHQTNRLSDDVEVEGRRTRGQDAIGTVYLFKLGDRSIAPLSSWPQFSRVFMLGC